VQGENVQVKPDVNIAIIGRPNVGNRRCLNQLVGAERSIVSSPVPAYTRHGGYEVSATEDVSVWDTAGIRRKGKTTVAEK